MDTTGVIQSIIILILLLLSAFFSSAETAFSTVNRVRLRTLVEEGNKRAIIVTKILDNYGKMISAILIGNNIVNISASSLVTTLVIRITGGNTYVGVATGVLTILVLLFGEITPKNWAKSYSEPISLAYGRIIYGMMKLLTPVIFIVDLLAKGIMKLLHIDPNKKDIMTESELKIYVDVSHEDGVIESEEREMIFNVFDFSDSLAKDVMIPRINMVTVSEDASYEEVMEIFRESMYTRLPVYRDDQDNVIGLINIKDFILNSDKTDFHIAEILRDAYYTYEFKKTSDLMFEMREKTYNVAFVLNEYGATIGMITLEDILEEIVGEIRDEYDTDEEELIQELEENTFLVEGSMKLDDINNALDTGLESEDYDSIGGIIIGSLDRLPEDNEEVTLEDGTTLKVQGIEQNRILKVLMTLPVKPADENNEEAENSEKESE